MEVPMFHDRHFGDREASLDALNRARLSHGLEPYQPPTHSAAGTVVLLLILVALLTLLMT
jgi:hypothetical protein